MFTRHFTGIHFRNDILWEYDHRIFTEYSMVLVTQLLTKMRDQI